MKNIGVYGRRNVKFHCRLIYGIFKFVNDRFTVSAVDKLNILQKLEIRLCSTKFILLQMLNSILKIYNYAFATQLL